VRAGSGPCGDGFDGTYTMFEQEQFGPSAERLRRQIGKTYQELAALPNSPRLCPTASFTATGPSHRTSSSRRSLRRFGVEHDYFLEYRTGNGSKQCLDSSTRLLTPDALTASPARDASRH
jgi:hypothetical protein